MFQGHAACPHCGGSFLLQGPIYSGKLHDKEFVDKVLGLAETKDFKTKEKVKGILVTVKEELETPLSWNLGSLCKFFKVPTLPQKQFRSAIRALGKETSQAHTGAVNYKTNASAEDMFNIMKYWRKEKAGDRYLTGIAEDSPIYRVLIKEPTCESIDFSQEYTEHEKDILKQVRFPMNEANWGPAARPTKVVEENDEEAVS